MLRWRGPAKGRVLKGAEVCARTPGGTGEVRLSGWLVCATEAEADAVRAHLPDHLALTRAEPGCLSFAVTEAGPLAWRVEERFRDRAAFAAHQERSRASVWYAATQGIERRYEVDWGGD